MMETVLRDASLDFISLHHVATLGTYGSDGVWAAAVYYANDAFVLYFFSSPRARHIRNLRSRSQVAVAIHENYERWEEIKGVQGSGWAEPVPGAEVADGWAIYLRRFPGLTSSVVSPGVFQFDGTRFAPELWRIHLAEVYFMDNSRGFGWRERLELGEDA